MILEWPAVVVGSKEISSSRFPSLSKRWRKYSPSGIGCGSKFTSLSIPKGRNSTASVSCEMVPRIKVKEESWLSKKKLELYIDVAADSDWIDALVLNIALILFLKR